MKPELPKPTCDVCGKPADWQIGTDIPFKSRARFYCAAHAPSGTPQWFAEQEMERDAAERRLRKALRQEGTG